MCLNTVDPITQEFVKDIKVQFYVYLGHDRAYVTLDAVATAEYILATGDTKNPITQEPFKVPELRRLDKLTVGVCASVLENLGSAKKRQLWTWSTCNSVKPWKWILPPIGVMSCKLPTACLPYLLYWS